MDIKLTKEQIEEFRRSAVLIYEDHGQALGKEYLDALCDLALRGLATQWRPIKEAPNDDTAIVVYAAEQEGLPAFFTTSTYYTDAGWCVDEFRYATHFFPVSALGEPKL